MYLVVNVSFKASGEQLAPCRAQAGAAARHRAGSVCSQGSVALTLGHKVLVLDLQCPREGTASGAVLRAAGRVVPAGLVPL